MLRWLTPPPPKGIYLVLDCSVCSFNIQLTKSIVLRSKFFAFWAAPPRHRTRTEGGAARAEREGHLSGSLAHAYKKAFSILKSRISIVNSSRWLAHLPSAEETCAPQLRPHPSKGSASGPQWHTHLPAPASECFPASQGIRYVFGQCKRSWSIRHRYCTRVARHSRHISSSLPRPSFGGTVCKRTATGPANLGASSLNCAQYSPKNLGMDRCTCTCTRSMRPTAWALHLCDSAKAMSLRAACSVCRLRERTGARNGRAK